MSMITSRMQKKKAVTVTLYIFSVATSNMKPKVTSYTRHWNAHLFHARSRYNLDDSQILGSHSSDLAPISNGNNKSVTALQRSVGPLFLALTEKAFCLHQNIRTDNSPIVLLFSSLRRTLAKLSRVD